jgi:hypothetical protein
MLCLLCYYYFICYFLQCIILQCCTLVCIWLYFAEFNGKTQGDGKMENSSKWREYQRKNTFLGGIIGKLHLGEG